MIRLWQTTDTSDDMSTENRRASAQPRAGKGHEMTGPKTRSTGTGRVSPTAPRSKSVSAAVWDHLVAEPGFKREMDRGIAQADAGRVVPLKDEVEPRR